MVGLNQNHPMTLRRRTGRTTHQTAKELNLPVMDAPMKLADVQIQRTTIVERQTLTGDRLMPSSSDP